jgi:O-antigen/teichoic acid export membrane protein
MRREVGVYAASGVVAKAPALALIPLATVVFPMISRALAEHNPPEAQKYGYGVVRTLTLVLLPVATLVALESENIVRLLFTDKYAGGGVYLALQVFGFSFLGFTVIFLSVLQARGDYYLALWICVGQIVVMLLLGLLMIPGGGPVGAAWALTISTGTGAALSALLVSCRFAPVLGRTMISKVVGATAIVALLCAQNSTSGLLLVLKMSGLASVYGLLLWWSKELKREDLDVLMFWRLYNG